MIIEAEVELEATGAAEIYATYRLNGSSGAAVVLNRPGSRPTLRAVGLLVGFLVGLLGT